MPYIFVDDGYPEADEYVNNYVWYDEDDPESLKRAWAEVRRRCTRLTAFADRKRSGARPR
jgi:hypothetical protein